MDLAENPVQVQCWLQEPRASLPAELFPENEAFLGESERVVAVLREVTEECLLGERVRSLRAILPPTKLKILKRRTTSMSPFSSYGRVRKLM